MPEPDPLTPTSTGAKPYDEQCVTPIFFLTVVSSLCVDLDLNIQPSLTVMALPHPLRSGPRRLADYLPIRGLRIRSLQDCVPGAVVALMRAHPRRLVDVPVTRIHFSTTCPFPIPLPPLSDLLVNPGIYRQR
jgi:hypothetical protein